MIQIKSFLSSELIDLEEQMNDWLSEQERISIFDCQYQVGTTIQERELEEEVEVEEALYYSSLLLYRIDL